MGIKDATLFKEKIFTKIAPEAVVPLETLIETCETVDYIITDLTGKAYSISQGAYNVAKFNEAIYDILKKFFKVYPNVKGFHGLFDDLGCTIKAKTYIRSRKKVPLKRDEIGRMGLNIYLSSNDSTTQAKIDSIWGEEAMQINEQYKWEGKPTRTSPFKLFMARYLDTPACRLDFNLKICEMLMNYPVGETKECPKLEYIKIHGVPNIQLRNKVYDKRMEMLSEFADVCLILPHKEFALNPSIFEFSETFYTGTKMKGLETIENMDNILPRGEADIKIINNIKWIINQNKDVHPVICVESRDTDFIVILLLNFHDFLNPKTGKPYCTIYIDFSVDPGTPIKWCGEKEKSKLDPIYASRRLVDVYKLWCKIYEVIEEIDPLVLDPVSWFCFLAIMSGTDIVSQVMPKFGFSNIWNAYRAGGFHILRDSIVLEGNDPSLDYFTMERGIIYNDMKKLDDFFKFCMIINIPDKRFKEFCRVPGSQFSKSDFENQQRFRRYFMDGKKDSISRLCIGTEEEAEIVENLCPFDYEILAVRYFNSTEQFKKFRKDRLEKDKLDWCTDIAIKNYRGQTLLNANYWYKGTQLYFIDPTFTKVGGQSLYGYDLVEGSEEEDEKEEDSLTIKAEAFISHAGVITSHVESISEAYNIEFNIKKRKSLICLSQSVFTPK